MRAEAELSSAAGCELTAACFSAMGPTITLPLFPTGHGAPAAYRMRNRAKLNIRRKAQGAREEKHRASFDKLPGTMPGTGRTGRAWRKDRRGE